VATLDNVMTFLNDFMGDAENKDHLLPNGLQVRGREELKLLATGVSASGGSNRGSLAKGRPILRHRRGQGGQI
jgi:hypothetical protein